MRLRLALVLASLALPAVSCRKEAGVERFIAVIPKGTTHEFWTSVHAGANKAAHELGVKIVWKGPPREDDRASQIDVVDDAVTRRMAAIVLAPLDDQALVAPCLDAKAQGIPVVIIDSGLKWDGMASFVATDNRRGGSLAAERLGEVLGGKGRAMMLRYQEGSASTSEREAGFLETMKAKFPGVELVSTDQYGGATADSALRAMENLLGRFPRLDGLFTPNESTTFGALRALEGAGRAGADGVKLVGFDASAPLLDGLQAGKIRGLVVQNPFRMGELGVKAAVDALDGKPLEKRVDTGCFVATPENHASPEIAAMLHPDVERWLR
jgi:ribose transport system substrate-binding protein